MKIATIIALAAPVLAVPRGKHLVELSLPGEQNYNPNQSLYPQRALRVIGSFQSGYTEKTFRAEAKKQCQTEPACSTVIGYLQAHSEVVDGSTYPVWFAWLIGGARATAADFHHANGTKHSFVYTINE